MTPPLKDRRALLTLAQMDADAYDALRSVLAKTEKPELPEDVEMPKVDEESRPILRVIQTVFTMYSVKASNNLDVPEFVDAVMKGVEDAHEPVFSSSETTSATTRLNEILSLDGAVNRRSRARSMVREHGMVFCGCRVMTDVRPVFSKDPDEEPQEMVIVHTLKLAYHEDDEHKEMYVSADGNDLKALREALDRAERKERTLSRMLNAKDIRVTDPEESN